MTTADIDQIIADYLHRLDVALGRLPESRRRQLVAEIDEHLKEARAELSDQSEAAIRELLDRVGQPDDIAAEAMDGQASQKRKRLSRSMVVVLIGLAVLLGGCLSFGFVVGIAHRSTSIRKVYVEPTKVITTPNIVGLTEAQAASALLSLGLIMATQVLPGASVTAGQVVSQEPAAGSRIPLGSRIMVSVSNGISGPATSP